MSIKEDLKERIINKEIFFGVIGLGYVGLPLAVEFANAGFKVLGFDISPEKVESVNKGTSYIDDIPSQILKPLVESGKLQATTDFDRISEVDAISICVPTPLRKTKDPDISYILSATKEIAKRLRRGHIVILESTTYPGTTEEIVKPELEKNGLRAGKDFFLAFSPERVDPGNRKYTTKNTPKVVGGVTPDCLELVSTLYNQVIDSIVPVSSPKAAEMTKILENTFRAINIGLANETAIICEKLGIDVWEVIEAAATKPFGFMPFYPGPGLGGHCIPIDPHYLSWKLKSYNYNARFIQLADEINTSMPIYVVEKVSQALNDAGKPINGSKILVLGVAYKPDISDTRESPSLDIISLLMERKGIVFYNDPYIQKINEAGLNMTSVPLNNLEEYDVIVIVTNHSKYNYREIVEKAQLIVDTRNATRGISSPKIYKL